ncbi:MAG: transposase [Lawsonibacter sp.]
MLPKRKSTAIPHYDYSQPGAYFITLCVEKRRPILGKIDSSPQVVLSSIGKIVSDVWYSLPQRFPCLDAISQSIFVVVPDHIHGILHITAGGASPSPTLHQILGSFKSITTIETNRLLGTPGQKLWQRSAYEHILRNQQDFDEAAGYIAENPARRLKREEFE